MSLNKLFRNKILWTIVCGLIISCKYSKEPKTFTTEKISIQYPAYLSKSNHVYPTPQTILQLKNDYRDVYFILIDFGQKPGEKGFDIMFDSVTNQLKKNLKELLIEKDTAFITANNLKTREMHLSGVLSSEKQAHRFLFIVDLMEDKNGHIYQTAGWLLRHKKQLWQNDIITAAHSLQVKEKNIN